MIPHPLPPRAPTDSVGSGVGIAFTCQLALMLAGGVAILLSVGFNSLFGLPFGAALFAGWGLLQWLVLLPLYFLQRRKRRPLAAKGILIAGCVGFLLNAGCDFALGIGPFR
jgi:hypothetical protein